MGLQAGAAPPQNAPDPGGRGDLLIRAIHVGLVILVSPALLLVLVIGGLFLIVEKVSRLVSPRRGRPDRPAPPAADAARLAPVPRGGRAG